MSLIIALISLLLSSFGHSPVPFDKIYDCSNTKNGNGKDKIK